MRTIPASELIINDDGSIFHLHLRPEQLADTVILVGDPGRVALVAEHFDSRECEISNREFRTVTGSYKGRRMTVLSTGIGIGNIDISVTELDALANVDFATRQEKAEKRRLTLVRLGTSGAIQPDIRVGEMVFAHVGRVRRPAQLLQGAQRGLRPGDRACLHGAHRLERTAPEALLHRRRPDALRALPRLHARGHHHRRTGFYAPQGRWVRLEPQDAPEREDRVVRLPRTPHHQLRDGGFGAGRPGSPHGTPRRHDLHDHRPAGGARRLHGLQALRPEDDRNGARQTRRPD